MRTLSDVLGIKRHRVRSFILLHCYWIAIAAFALLFHPPLYATVTLFMLIPGLYFGYKVHREKRFLVEALLFSIPAIITLDLVGHISKSWDYWRSEIFGVFIGPYALIGFYWGFCFWIGIVAYYEFFFDKSASRQAPRQEKWFAFVAFAAAGAFLWMYDGQFVPLFYIWLIVGFLVVNIIVIRRYHFSFWRTYVPIIALFPASLLNEYITLELGHWTFDQAANILYIPFFGHSVPIEEILWFLVVQHSVILLHEIFADNAKC